MLYEHRAECDEDILEDLADLAMEEDPIPWVMPEIDNKLPLTSRMMESLAYWKDEAEGRVEEYRGIEQQQEDEDDEDEDDEDEDDEDEDDEDEDDEDEDDEDEDDEDEDDEDEDDEDDERLRG